MTSLQSEIAARSKYLLDHCGINSVHADGQYLRIDDIVMCRGGPDLSIFIYRSVGAIMRLIYIVPDVGAVKKTSRNTHLNYLLEKLRKAMLLDDLASA